MLSGLRPADRSIRCRHLEAKIIGTLPTWSSLSLQHAFREIKHLRGRLSLTPSIFGQSFELRAFGQTPESVATPHNPQVPSGMQKRRALVARLLHKDEKTAVPREPVFGTTWQGAARNTSGTAPTPLSWFAARGIDIRRFFPPIEERAQGLELAAVRSLARQPEVVGAFWQPVCDPLVAINAGFIACKQ